MGTPIKLPDCNSCAEFDKLLKAPGMARMCDIIATAVSLKNNAEALRLAAGVNKMTFDRWASGEIEPEQEVAQAAIESWRKMRLFGAVAA